MRPAAEFGDRTRAGGRARHWRELVREERKLNEECWGFEETMGSVYLFVGREGIRNTRFGDFGIQKQNPLGNWRWLALGLSFCLFVCLID